MPSVPPADDNVVEFSRLVAAGLTESPRNSSRLNPLSSAMAALWGLSAEEVAAKTVDQVSSVLKTRLGEWGTWRPDLRVGVIILETARDAHVDHELAAATEITKNAMARGVFGGDAVLFFANPNGIRDGWAPALTVERAGSGVAEKIAAAFPTIRRTRIEGQPKPPNGVASGTGASSRRYWAIAAGEGARLWPAFQAESIAAIGWDELGDLRQYNTKEEVADAILRIYDKTGYPVNDALACHQFCREIAAGDHVLVKKGVSEILGYGVVESEYLYDPNRSEYRNVRRVRWTNTGTWELPEDCQVPQKTLTDVTRYKALLEHILPLVSASPKPKVVSESAPPAYTVDDALDPLFIDREDFVRMLETLIRKRNLVLEGPPGVGKTFVAKRLAYALIGRKDSSKIEMVQFHQSYSYEDFVRGWRPSASGGFSLQNGVFVEFCRRARKDPSGKYVFIIDEINRGNLSKVFGELLMLIESDKRGPDYEIPLAYTREGESDEDRRFFVPENVFILGMMNTADRSLAMVDYALRRRFGFIRLLPAFQNPKFKAFLEERGVAGSLVERIVSHMTALNEEITGDTKNLGPGFEIGHSFFCPQGTEDNCGPEWYAGIIRSEIAPLLKEYWFDDPEHVESLISTLVA